MIIKVFLIMLFFFFVDLICMQGIISDALDKAKRKKLRKSPLFLKLSGFHIVYVRGLVVQKFFLIVIYICFFFAVLMHIIILFWYSDCIIKIIDICNRIFIALTPYIIVIGLVYNFFCSKRS